MIFLAQSFLSVPFLHENYNHEATRLENEHFRNILLFFLLHHVTDLLMPSQKYIFIGIFRLSAT